jgi:transposase
MERKSYPSDVSADEWAFVAPYLTLMTADAPQREHSLREVFNGLRWPVRAGAAWRLRPHDLPPWHTVSQQSQRWLKAGVFETMVIDLRELLRVAHGRKPQPSAAIFDSRTLPSTPESGTRAGFDPAKSRRGSKVHVAVDTLGHLLAVLVTPANAQDRHQVAELTKQAQEVTGDAVELAFVDQAYSGQQAVQDAAANHMALEVVKLSQAKRGFVVLPRCWVVERSQGWAARFHRLARGYEQLAETLKGWHVVAFAMLMLKQLTTLIL